MKVGFVGTCTVFREANSNGIKHGQIDVIQTGDHQYPTQSFTINIFDSASCRMLLEILENNPTPLIRAILWLEVIKGEMKITLLQMISVNESLFAVEGDSF